MSYRILKHDFTQDELCQICNSGRILKEAYFLIDESTLEEIITSQSCVRNIQNKISNWNGPFPDFTKGIIQENGKKRNSNDSTEQNGKKERKRIENDSLIEYLVYRQEKLKAFNGIFYDGIQYIYESYKKNYELTEDQINHLKNFVLKTEREFPQFSINILRRL